MGEAISKFAAPFINMPVYFEGPPRRDFTVRRFKGVVGAIKLLWRHRKNPALAKAETAYNEAVRLHSVGRFNDAEALYHRCIELYPDHEPAYANLGALYIKRNSIDLAVEELKKGIEARPHYYRCYYNLGVTYKLMGELNEASRQFELALKYNHGFFWADLCLGEIAASRNQLETATSHYLKALTHCEQPELIYIRLAEFYLQRKELAQSQHCLEKALEVKPTPELYYNLGWLSIVSDEEPEVMVDHFLKARELRSDFKEALLNLAFCQCAAGYHEQSVQNLERYLHDYTRNTDEDLLTHLDYLRRINPLNYVAGLRVARMYMDRDRVEKAIEVLVDIRKTAKNYGPAELMLAEIYRRMGRHKEAIGAYRRLIDIDPEESKGYLGLARCYGDIENFAAAMPVLRKLLELQPRNVDVHYQYATLTAQDGNFPVALKHYKIVASLDAAYPRIQKRLRMLEAEMEEASEESASPWPIANAKARRLMASDNARNEIDNL